jgi:hypothetical protein
MSGKRRGTRRLPNRQEKIMITSLSRRGPHTQAVMRKAGHRRGRIIGVPAAVMCSLAACAALLPAASVRAALSMLAVPEGPGQYGITPVGSALYIIHVAIADWQLTLAALGAALAATAITADSLSWIRANRRRACVRAE